MKYFEEFRPSGYTFRERTGEPNAFDAGIGKIVLYFSRLEDIVSNSILQLLGLHPGDGWIITSELSFKNKVNIMACLVRRRLSSTWFNVGHNPPAEVLDEMVRVLCQVEELHSRILHSSWGWTMGNEERWTRSKLTAEARHGLREQVEEMGPDGLLDIADYICSVGVEVEEFFLGMETRCPLEDSSGDEST